MHADNNCNSFAIISNTPRAATVLTEWCSPSPRHSVKHGRGKNGNYASSLLQRDPEQTSSQPQLILNRSRKSERLPHAANERRYRVKLNAHFEILATSYPLSTCDLPVSQASSSPPPSFSPRTNPGSSDVANYRHCATSYPGAAAGAQNAGASRANVRFLRVPFSILPQSSKRTKS